MDIGLLAYYLFKHPILKEDEDIINRQSVALLIEKMAKDREKQEEDLQKKEI